MLKKILIGLGVVVVAFLGFAATRPSAYHVERSATMAAPADIVFEQLTDLQRWAAWSPWEKLDPEMTKTFSDPARGVGASYTWQGEQAGKGKMTIVREEVPREIAYKLEFIEPFASTAEASFALASSGAEQTQVTWAMDGENNFIGKVMCIFMDMDAMIGADFEKGLAALSTIAEAEAEKRRADQAASAAAQAAGGAAPAAAATPAP